MPSQRQASPSVSRWGSCFLNSAMALLKSVKDKRLTASRTSIAEDLRLQGVFLRRQALKKVS